jgi:hypothetical protein
MLSITSDETAEKRKSQPTNSFGTEIGPVEGFVAGDIPCTYLDVLKTPRV